MKTTAMALAGRGSCVDTAVLGRAIDTCAGLAYFRGDIHDADEASVPDSAERPQADVAMDPKVYLLNKHNPFTTISTIILPQRAALPQPASAPRRVGPRSPHHSIVTATHKNVKPTTIELSMITNVAHHSNVTVSVYPEASRPPHRNACGCAENPKPQMPHKSRRRRDGRSDTAAITSWSLNMNNAL